MGSVSQTLRKSQINGSRTSCGAVLPILHRWTAHCSRSGQRMVYGGDRPRPTPGTNANGSCCGNPSSWVIRSKRMCRSHGIRAELNIPLGGQGDGLTCHQPRLTAVLPSCSPTGASIVPAKGICEWSGWKPFPPPGNDHENKPTTRQNVCPISPARLTLRFSTSVIGSFRFRVSYRSHPSMQIAFLPLPEAARTSSVKPL